MPLPKTASGHRLPPIFELIRRDGNAENGRAVFFRAGANSCGNCHRVQGSGQWVGPDLSTIGVKYGKDELVRSILSPSAAVGYNFRSNIVALTDGRIVTGLPVEENAGNLVVKTAQGERVSVPTNTIEDRRISDLSLMPEGLAQTMSDQDFVDLLAYLTTLKQPVSIVGQYQAIGPVDEPLGRPIFDPISKLNLHGPVNDGKGHELSWRRVSASAEGQADLSPLIGEDPRNAVYVWVPVTSTVAQKARLVVDSPTEFLVWLDGKPVGLSAGAAGKNEPRTASIDLPEGSSTLLIRMTAGAKGKAPASLVTTLVADRPVAFSAVEGTSSASLGSAR